MKHNFDKYAHIPFGNDLLQIVVAEIMATFPDDLQAMQNSIVILPSQRACRLLQDKLLAASQDSCMVLPRIFTYADLHNHLIYFAPFFNELRTDIYAEISNIAFDLFITNVLRHEQVETSWHFVAEIRRFLVEFFTYNNDANHLMMLEDQSLARLLQQIITQLEQRKLCLKQQARHQVADYMQNATINERCIGRLWLVAPSNNSPAILRILKKLQSHPASQLFFYGLGKQNCAPQAAYHALLAHLNVLPTQVPRHKAASKQQQILELCQPAHLVPQWQGDDVPLLQHVHISPCADQQQEVETVAILVRDQLHQHPTANIAIVCEHAALRVQIQTALLNWQIQPEVSEAATLREYKACQLFLAILELGLATQFDSVLLLSVLKNQYCKLACEDKAQWLAELECDFLRPQKITNWQELANYPYINEFVAHIKQLQQVCYSKNSLTNILQKHLQIFQQMIYDVPEDIIDELHAIVFETAHDGQHCFLNAYEYAAWLQKLFASHKLRQSQEYHANVKIVTALEAKFLDLDTIIFCGLNQGVFPQAATHSNLISIAERVKLKLPIGEDNQQEQFLDFLNLLARTRVFLTYAKVLSKENSEPSVLLEKLQLYLEKFVEASLLSDVFSSHYHNLLLALRELQKLPPPIAKMPLSPPLDARPQRYSAKSIAELMNNPYTFYAHYILKLKPLDELNADLMAKNFGIILHAAIAEAVPQSLKHSQEYFVKYFSECFNKHAAFGIDNNEAQLLWPIRTTRIAGWLWQYEQQIGQGKSYYELKGRQRLPLAENYAVDIEATADRIIYDAAGNVRVLDYKTGVAPSNAEVKQGLAPQLPVEGWLLLNGGYVLNNAQEMQFYYIQLSGKKDIGEEKLIKFDLQNVEKDLRNLLMRFTLAAAPYWQTNNARNNMVYDAYLHLGRVSQN